MQTSPNSPHKSYELFYQELNSYLNSSRLSLTGLSQKLNISKAQLSLIKNKKKHPSLDLGLKILKYVGTCQESRKQWALAYLTNNSEEYEELESSVSEEMKKLKMSQSVCERFENNMTFMNLYLDILNTDEGLSAHFIERNYGKEGLGLADTLVSAGLASKEKLDGQKIFKASENRSVMTKKSSFHFVNSLISDQRDKFVSGNWNGRMQFFLDDIDLEGQKKLDELLLKTMKQASEIVKKHEKPRTKGGARYAFQMLAGQVKGSLIVLLMSFFAIQPQGSLAQTIPFGGVEGGASTSMRVHFVNKFDKEPLEQKIHNLYEQTHQEGYSDLQEKAYQECNSKFRMIQKSDVKPSIQSINFDRFWLHKELHHEVHAKIKVQCSPHIRARALN